MNRRFVKITCVVVVGVMAVSVLISSAMMFIN